MKKIAVLYILSILLIAKEPIEPIKELTYNYPKAILGMTLFNDPSLSSDKTVSCQNCHKYNHGGADTKPFSRGVKERKGFINSPTVYNAVFNFRQFWNGRAKTLEEQEIEPLTNHHEMNMTKGKIEKYLNSNDYYISRFKKIYHTKPTMENMINAIAEFEKTLTTPNSKFDRYLRGETQLSKKELKGYNIFKSYGCITCHNGINVGGNSFQKIGILNPFPRLPNTLDRFAVTKNPHDKNVFKVPTLRNIALTSPYFHNATQKTLKNAIKSMAYYNLGFDLEDDEVEEIESFLKTLTGEKPKFLTFKEK